MRLLVAGDVVADAEQIIHVVVAVQQTLLLIAVDVERRLLAGGENRERLIRQIDLETSLRIGRDRSEDLFQERLAELNRQQAVVQRIVLEYVGEKTRHDHAEAVVENGPGRVLARRAATEVLRGAISPP